MKMHAEIKMPTDVDAFGFFELADIPAVLFDSELNLLRANKSFHQGFSYRDGKIGASQARVETASEKSQKRPLLDVSTIDITPFLNALSASSPHLTVEMEMLIGEPYRLSFNLGPNNSQLMTLRALGKNFHEEYKLEQLCQSMQIANKELVEFSHAASHDMRTPLRAMRTIPEWIKADLRDSNGGLPESTEYHLDLIQQQAQRLQAMLDDLLTFTSIGQYENIDLPISLQKTLIELRRELLATNSFTLQIPREDLLLLVPAKELRLALVNLLENAIRHHHQSSGHLAVELHKTKDYVSICVIDDGPGIPEQYHEAALRIFSTLNSRDQVEGSGMGLAITNKILRNWGGKLSIQSGIDGSGTRINMVIPTQRCAA